VGAQPALGGLLLDCLFNIRFVSAAATRAPDSPARIVLALFMAFNPALVEAAKAVLAVAKVRKLSIVTAESCTSGLLASVLSEAPGAKSRLPYIGSSGLASNRPTTTAERRN
jgi:Competence-damaged protein